MLKHILVILFLDVFDRAVLGLVLVDGSASLDNGLDKIDLFGRDETLSTPFSGTSLIR